MVPPSLNNNNTNDGMLAQRIYAEPIAEAPLCPDKINTQSKKYDVAYCGKTSGAVSGNDDDGGGGSSSYVLRGEITPTAPGKPLAVFALPWTLEAGVWKGLYVNPLTARLLGHRAYTLGIEEGKAKLQENPEISDSLRVREVGLIESALELMRKSWAEQTRICTDPAADKRTKDICDRSLRMCITMRTPPYASRTQQAEGDVPMTLVRTTAVPRGLALLDRAEVPVWRQDLPDSLTVEGLLDSGTTTDANDPVVIQPLSNVIDKLNDGNLQLLKYDSGRPIPITPVTLAALRLACKQAEIPRDVIVLIKNDTPCPDGQTQCTQLGTATLPENLLTTFPKGEESQEIESSYFIAIDTSKFKQLKEKNLVSLLVNKFSTITNGLVSNPQRGNDRRVINNEYFDKVGQAVRKAASKAEFKAVPSLREAVQLVLGMNDKEFEAALDARLEAIPKTGTLAGDSNYGTIPAAVAREILLLLPGSFEYKTPDDTPILTHTLDADQKVTISYHKQLLNPRLQKIFLSSIKKATSRLEQKDPNNPSWAKLGWNDLQEFIRTLDGEQGAFKVHKNYQYGLQVAVDELTAAMKKSDPDILVELAKWKYMIPDAPPGGIDQACVSTNGAEPFPTDYIGHIALKLAEKGMNPMQYLYQTLTNDGLAAAPGLKLEMDIGLRSPFSSRADDHRPLEAIDEVMTSVTPHLINAPYGTDEAFQKISGKLAESKQTHESGRSAMDQTWGIQSFAMTAQTILVSMMGVAGRVLSSQRPDSMLGRSICGTGALGLGYGTFTLLDSVQLKAKQWNENIDVRIQKTENVLSELEGKLGAQKNVVARVISNRQSGLDSVREPARKSFETDMWDERIKHERATLERLKMEISGAQRALEELPKQKDSDWLTGQAAKVGSVSASLLASGVMWAACRGMAGRNAANPEVSPHERSPAPVGPDANSHPVRPNEARPIPETRDAGTAEPDSAADPDPANPERDARPATESRPASPDISPDATDAGAPARPVTERVETGAASHGSAGAERRGEHNKDADKGTEHDKSSGKAPKFRRPASRGSRAK